MNNRAGVASVLALACLLSTAPAAEAEQARAKPRFEVHERRLSLQVPIQADNGYRGWVTTEGHRQVTLTLYKGETTVEARTRGRVTQRGIEARFGDMGRISVRFRGEPMHFGRGNKDGERRCRGRKSRFEEGTFSGTIRFDGENGFTRVHLHRAEGLLERHYRRVCQQDSDGNAFREALERLIYGIPLTLLRARTRMEGVNVVFEAAAFDLRSIFGPAIGFGYSFSARTVERVQGMRLTRSVDVEGDEGSFLYRRGKKAPRTATVTPPKPFVGTAKYLEPANSPRSWVGSLTVRLPGAGQVEMTGPKFKADTCNLTLGGYVEGRCLPGPDQLRSRLLSRLGRERLQLSGSQSQAFWDARLSWSR